MCIRWNGVCVCSWSRHGEYLDRIFNSRFEGIASILSWILLRFLGKFDMVSKKHSTRSYCSMYVCVGPSIINRTRDNVVFVFGSLLDLGHVHLRDGLR
jgi:hypothetical protein